MRHVASLSSPSSHPFHHVPAFLAFAFSVFCPADPSDTWFEVRSSLPLHQLFPSAVCRYARSQARSLDGSRELHHARTFDFALAVFESLSFAKLSETAGEMKRRRVEAHSFFLPLPSLPFPRRRTCDLQCNNTSSMEVISMEASTNRLSPRLASSPSPVNDEEVSSVSRRAMSRADTRLSNR